MICGELISTGDISQHLLMMENKKKKDTNNLIVIRIIGQVKRYEYYFWNNRVSDLFTSQQMYLRRTRFQTACPCCKFKPAKLYFIGVFQIISPSRFEKFPYGLVTVSDIGLCLESDLIVVTVP